MVKLMVKQKITLQPQVLNLTFCDVTWKPKCHSGQKKKEVSGKAALLIPSYMTWNTCCAVIIDPPLPDQYVFHKRGRVCWERPRRPVHSGKFPSLLLTLSTSHHLGENPDTPKTPSCTQNLECADCTLTICKEVVQANVRDVEHDKNYV